MQHIRFLLLLLIFISASNTYGQIWKGYADTAKVLLDRKYNSEAIEYYLKANEFLKKDSIETRSYIRNNNDIGDLYVTLGQYNKAEPFYAEAMQGIAKITGKENTDYATSCNNLGRLYRLMGQYEKAQPLLLEAKGLREKILGKDNADYATSCNNLAVFYLEVGQYEMARPLYLEAKQIREKVLGKNHIDYATSCNNLGVLHVVTGKPELAEPLYLEAKQIREKVLGKEHPFYAASCNNLAALYLDLGQYGKAEPLYLEAKQIREKVLGKEHPEYAASCDNLAILYLDIGQYEKAEPLYIEAKQIREKILGTGHPEYAKSCNNLALFYRMLGQYEKAEPLLIEANNLLGTILGKEHPEYAKICNNLGALYMDMGNYQKAGALYNEAKLVWEKVLGKDHPEFAKSCNNLALIFRNSGEFEKAESLLLEASQIREKALGKEHPDYAQSCDNLAVLYTNMGQYNKAEPLHIIAKQVREQALGKEHPDFVQSCINLANLNWNLQEFGKANRLYSDAFNAQQVQVKNLFQFTTEPEKQSYLKKVNEFKNYFLSYSSSGLAQPESAYAYAVSLANRNLILSSSRHLRSAIYSATDTSIKNKYNDWIRLREQLSFWYTKPIAGRPAYLQDLKEQSNTLEKELTRLSSEFKAGQEQESIGWQTIQQHLKPNEAAIEFVEFQYYNGKRWTDSIYYVALILRKDKQEPEMVSLFEKRELDELFKKKSNLADGGKNFIDSMYLVTIEENKDLSKSAYHLIWQPLEKSLDGIAKIYFAPAGLLHRISHGAIPVSSKEVLSDKYKLVQLNTTASVVNLPVNSLSASGKILLYGGVKYNADSSSLKLASQPYASNSNSSSPSFAGKMSRDDRGNTWEYLPASQTEINEIERLGKQKKIPLGIFNDVNATEESIKSLNAKHSPSVLHVATHGFFFPDQKENKKDDIQSGFETSGKVFKQSDNPLFRSGLLLAGANNAWKGKPVEGVEDGILTAYEVSNLYLPNTKLVVLSACETGLGDIQGSEGVYGLQRSFKIAGVQNLVMSLWKVPDEATAEFMKLFYQNMFNKQSISNAFYNAQASMKNKYRNNPYNWAAWILVR